MAFFIIKQMYSKEINVNEFKNVLNMYAQDFCIACIYKILM